MGLEPIVRCGTGAGGLGGGVESGDDTCEQRGAGHSKGGLQVNGVGPVAAIGNPIQ